MHKYKHCTILIQWPLLVEYLKYYNKQPTQFLNFYFVKLVLTDSLFGSFTLAWKNFSKLMAANWQA